MNFKIHTYYIQDYDAFFYFCNSFIHPIRLSKYMFITLICYTVLLEHMINVVTTTRWINTNSPLRHLTTTVYKAQVHSKNNLLSIEAEKSD